VGVGLVVGQVVDGDDLDVVRVPLEDRAERETTNSAKAVNTDADCHFRETPEVSDGPRRRT